MVYNLIAYSKSFILYEFAVENNPAWFMHLQYVECLSRDIDIDNDMVNALRNRESITETREAIKKKLSEIKLPQYVNIEMGIDCWNEIKFIAVFSLFSEVMSIFSIQLDTNYAN